jgi:Vitamin B12 dependent methionine synthase, activation domain
VSPAPSIEFAVGLCPSALQSSGVADYLGLFANASFGLEPIVEAYKAAGDDYNYIMAEAIADRLAEAFAEKLHELVRKELWGYAPAEALSREDLLRVKYQVSLLRGRSNVSMVSDNFLSTPRWFQRGALLVQQLAPPCSEHAVHRSF